MEDGSEIQISTTKERPMNKSNQNISFRGSRLHVSGREVKEGDLLPAFKLVANDMSEVEAQRYAGKVLVICAVPSLDTPTCAIETKRFNDEAAKLSANVSIVVVSLDLPFAQKRWCGQEGVNRVETLSDYKYRVFGENFGAYIQEMGLLARAVFVVDKAGKVALVEYVTDISQEPSYDAILKKVAELAA